MQVHAQRQMEKLGRGVVAVRNGSDSVFVSWRILGTEQMISLSISTAKRGVKHLKS